MDYNNIRPSFHITGGKGWINDPNGLIKYKGLYHVFFQYYPHATNWGPMHWGHRVSEDLINWDELPTALFPKAVSNEDGCFSGTAIVHNDVLYLVYTGFYENGGGEAIRQVQCLASSTDGLTFNKHGIIIDETKLPSEINPSDFRDPKIWKEDEVFYMVVAARKRSNKGCIVMYKSLDIFNWEYVGIVDNIESLGTMIECPDYVKNLDLLLYSEQFQPNEGNKHLNIHTCRYSIGKLDINTPSFNNVNSDIVDYGFDFYAPQVFAGENIMIAWLNMWDRNNPSEKYGFAGQLTIPRKLEIKNNKLLQSPIWDYSNKVDTELSNHLEDNIKKGAVKLSINDLKDLNIKLRKKDNNYFNVSLNENELVFDRSKCGEKITGVEKDQDSINGIRRMPVDDLSNVEIEIIFDEFSLEFFVNGLSATFSVFTEFDADGLEIDIDAKSSIYSKSIF